MQSESVLMYKADPQNFQSPAQWNGSHRKTLDKQSLVTFSFVFNRLAHQNPFHTFTYRVHLVVNC